MYLIMRIFTSADWAFGILWGTATGSLHFLASVFVLDLAPDVVSVATHVGFWAAWSIVAAIVVGLKRNPA